MKRYLGYGLQAIAWMTIFILFVQFELFDNMNNAAIVAAIIATIPQWYGWVYEHILEPILTRNERLYTKRIIRLFKKTFGKTELDSVYIPVNANGNYMEYNQVYVTPKGIFVQSCDDMLKLGDIVSPLIDACPDKNEYDKYGYDLDVSTASSYHLNLYLQKHFSYIKDNSVKALECVVDKRECEALNHTLLVITNKKAKSRIVNYVRKMPKIYTKAQVQEIRAFLKNCGDTLHEENYNLQFQHEYILNRIESDIYSLPRIEWNKRNDFLADDKDKNIARLIKKRLRNKNEINLMIIEADYVSGGVYGKYPAYYFDEIYVKKMSVHNAWSQKDIPLFEFPYIPYCYTWGEKYPLTVYILNQVDVPTGKYLGTIRKSDSLIESKYGRDFELTIRNGRTSFRNLQQLPQK